MIFSLFKEIKYIKEKVLKQEYNTLRGYLSNEKDLIPTTQKDTYLSAFIEKIEDFNGLPLLQIIKPKLKEDSEGRQYWATEKEEIYLREESVSKLINQLQKLNKQLKKRRKYNEKTKL